VNTVRCDLGVVAQAGELFRASWVVADNRLDLAGHEIYDVVV